MVGWIDLLLPALASAVAVFLASSVVHMVLQWHKPDYRRLANEDEVRAVLRKTKPAPGQYVAPLCKDPKEAATPEMQAKYAEGVNAVIYVGPYEAPKMGKYLGSWFVYSIVLSLLAGYVGKAALPAGAAFADVLQMVGVAAFLGYALQAPSDSIWKFKPWIITFRSMVDGLVYAVVTGLVFAWLWPA